MKVVSNAVGAPKPVGPYSQAITANGLVFCAGQIGLDPDTTKMVEGGLEAQTVRVLENLKAVLKAAGSGIEKVVMTTIFLTDMADGAVVNKIYAEYVSADTPPARQTVAVKALPLGALVEISVIASV